jgi:hypothetical protein
MIECMLSVLKEYHMVMTTTTWNALTDDVRALNGDT